MGTAHATLIFVSSMLGPCIAWMTGTHLRINIRRRTAPATLATRGFSQIPGEFNSCSDSDHDRAGEVKQ
jgi:hypothetical protein